MTAVSMHAPLTVADIEKHLATRRFGRRLELFEELDSTNTTARELAVAGADEGTTIITESQRRGRGRLGRSWASPAHRNLYLSLVLRPSCSPAVLPQLTLVLGLAAAEAVREWTADVKIKWPNDLLIAGRKLAGILTESVADDAGVQFVIPGIGVNLNSEPDDFPPDVRSLATSLRMVTGHVVDRPGFAGRLLNHCEARYDEWQRDGFHALAPAWETYSCLTGRAIVVQSQERGHRERIAGTAMGLADDGTLRVRAANGAEHHIVAGDVSVVDGYDRSLT